MSIRKQLKFGCQKLAIGHQLLLQRTLAQYPKGLSDRFFAFWKYIYQSDSITDARRCFANTPVKNDSSDSKRHVIDIKLDVQRSEAIQEDLSLPLLLYFYGPWKQLCSKWDFWKLKLLWDWSFAESNFMYNSQQAAVVITDLIRLQHKGRLERCTTPMGFKQINKDLFHDWRFQLMRYEQRHIYRAIPLKVQMLPHYDHKFAFIDVIYIALRRLDDFEASEEKYDIETLIDKYASHLRHENPLIFSEIFVRFRRDYSVEKNRYGGQWLVSSYKILNFDIIKSHPEFETSTSRKMLIPNDDIH